MVRLIKGAYWDTEIKISSSARFRRLSGFYTKTFTDVSFLACAKKLLKCRMHFIRNLLRIMPIVLLPF